MMVVILVGHCPLNRHLLMTGQKNQSYSVGRGLQKTVETNFMAFGE